MVKVEATLLPQLQIFDIGPDRIVENGNVRSDQAHLAYFQIIELNSAWRKFLVTIEEPEVEVNYLDLIGTDKGVDTNAIFLLLPCKMVQYELHIGLILAFWHFQIEQYTFQFYIPE